MTLKRYGFSRIKTATYARVSELRPKALSLIGFRSRLKKALKGTKARSTFACRSLMTKLKQLRVTEG
jgi:hypothetical protein